MLKRNYLGKFRVGNNLYNQVITLEFKTSKPGKYEK